MHRSNNPPGPNTSRIVTAPAPPPAFAGSAPVAQALLPVLRDPLSSALPFAPAPSAIPSPTPVGSSSNGTYRRSTRAPAAPPVTTTPLPFPRLANVQPSQSHRIRNHNTPLWSAEASLRFSVRRNPIPQRQSFPPSHHKQQAHVVASL